MKNINSESMKVENNFKFTRYLYEKQEVEIAFVISLLSNKIDESLFWAYELFYSGFEKEFFDLLVKVYYDFYACLNPSFGNFIIVKYNEYFVKNKVFEDRFVSMLVYNFITRPFNLDVFILRKCINNIKDTENIIIENNVVKYFKKLLQEKDYINISKYVYNLKEKDIKKHLVIITEYFEKNIKVNKSIIKTIDNYKKNKCLVVDIQTILLSIILHFYAIINEIKMGKNIYVVTQLEEIVKYETVFIQPSYKTLSKLDLYNINNSNYLHLFELKRDNSNILDAYLNKWLYYASFTPLWSKRINNFQGVINNETKCITFINEEDEEAFYKEFNYEPDEQKKEIQEKSIPSIVKVIEMNWNTFYVTFKNNSLLQQNNHFHFIDSLKKIEYF
jgi:hypothetical protein